MSPARVSIAGPLRIEHAGATLTGGVLDARRTRLIVVSLATSPDGLTSQALSERLWATRPPTWSAALRGAIARLREELSSIGLGDQQLVLTTSTGWRLHPEARVDLIEATERARRLEEGTAGLWEAVGELLPVAEAPVLPTDDAIWIDDLRTQQASLRARLLELRVGAATSSGRFSDAAQAATSLVATDPLSERSHRLLMTTLSAGGDRAGAIRAYEVCRTTLAEELGVDPSKETTDLYLELLRSGSSAVDSIPPLPKNGFFGRDRLLEEVSASLDLSGVTTVVGRGGVGKSRLALHVLHGTHASPLGARYWINLGNISDPLLARVAIAAGVGAEMTSDPLASVIDRLRQTAHDILVLDGCENVLDGAAEAVVALVEALPDLRILATSRVPLTVPHERRFSVASLPVADDSIETLVRSPAVRMLSERTEGHGGRLVIDARNLESVRALCERCEGIPLALELAAAQLGSMAVGDLLDSFAENSGGAVDALDVLLSQSFASLDSESSHLFSAWGVVDGALPLPLVRSLVGDEVPAGRVARLLGQLAEDGLVIIDRTGPHWKYRMDDHIRGFAFQRLVELGQPEARLEGLASGLRALLPEDPRTPPGAYRDAIANAGDGFRSVLAAASDGRLDRQLGLELAFRLHRYWAASGIAEGRFWLERLLHDAVGGDWTPFANFAAGYLSYWAADTDTALVQLRVAAESLRGIDDGFAARALVFAAGISDDLDQVDAAMEEIGNAIELARGADDPNLLITASMGVGSLLAERGSIEAIAPTREAIDLCRRIASSDQLQATLATAAMIAWQVGELEQAQAWIDEASALLEGPPRIAQVVLGTAAAGCRFATGSLEEAAGLAAQAVKGAEELGVDRELPLALAVAARIALAREDESAGDLALRCVDAAAALSIAFPSAIALETAAAVLGTSGEGLPLLAAAANIRIRGRRARPAAMAQDDGVDLTGMAAPDRMDALGSARQLLSGDRSSLR